MLGHLRDPRLVGAYLVGASLFFGWMGIFTYLPYRLSGAALVPLHRRHLGGLPRVRRRRDGSPHRRAAVLARAAAAAHRHRPGGGGARHGRGAPGALPLVVAGLVVMVLGTFTAQAVAPAFVNVTARTAKGGASALYLTFYYVGGTLGSAVPGLALHAAGWPGVVATCIGSVWSG